MIIRKEISRYLVNELDPVRAALAKIDGNEDGIVFCVNDRGLLIGVLTDGDLRRWLIRVSRPDIELPVGQIVNRQFVSANVADKPERIAALLKGALEVVPLVDKNGCCVAMASRRKPRIDIADRRIGAERLSRARGRGDPPPPRRWLARRCARAVVADDVRLPVRVRASPVAQ